MQEDTMSYHERISDYDGDPAPRKRSQSCQCGDDLPGRCPGPDNCPYSDRHDENEE